MLHVTNGDAATTRIREAGLPGEILPWRDVLHEGPVPDGVPNHELRALRARFLADQGWGNHEQILGELAERDAILAECTEREEVVLWFEHDLYDQLQLIQVLAFVAERDGMGERLAAVIVPEYLGHLNAERFPALFEMRRPVAANQRKLGVRGWNAFRSPDPTRLLAVLGGDTDQLPYLAPALTRHLEEFPSSRNGLSRSERQILEALQDGPMQLSGLFRAAHHDVEDPIFLGDAVFALHLQRLAGTRDALLEREEGGALRALRSFEEVRDFWEQRAVITDLGEAVLAADQDWIHIAGVDRWLGGVHLAGTEAAWRWDERARTLLPTAG